MREGWTRGVLGDLLHLDINKVSVQSGVEYPVVGVLGFGRGLLHREPVTSESTRYKELHEIRPGQLVYSKLKAFEGAITVVPDDAGLAYASPEFPTFTCTEVALPAYVQLLTQRPQLWEDMAAMSKGVGGRRERLHQRDLPQVGVIYPPVEEQQRIVDLIGALDDTIAAAGKHRGLLSATLAQRRDMVFSSGDTRLARDMFDILIGLQRSPARAVGPSQTPYLRSANVTHGRLILDDVKTMSFDQNQREKYALRSGDVLVSEGSASADAVGAPSKYQGELDGVVCFQNTLLRYRAVEGVTTPEFVSQWCSWAYESGAFRDAANGTNIKHIGSGGASQMRVVEVALEEQSRLTDELFAAQSAVERSSATLLSLRALRSNLLTVLLSGEHEIPESYDELMEEVAS